MKLIILLILLSLPVSILQVNAQDNIIKIWPSLAPGTEDRTDEEKVEENGNISKVYQPDLRMFIPDRRGNKKLPAIIIFPGGGYRQIVMQKEGYKIAQWLNRNGIAAFILKYRLNPGEALQDAQRALSLLRAKAGEINIDRNKIGVIGFSSGANVAGNLLTHYKKRDYIDDIDSVSCKPDFMIGLYGVYEPFLHKGNDPGQPNPFSFTPFGELVNRETPPVFLVHAADDSRVSVEHSINFFTALKRNGVPAELHIYEQGRHGFALEGDRGPVISWAGRCIDWLKVRGILAGK